MNIQCPNCQRLLQVPEQHAGQLMKCPLCQGTFTLPALPPAAPAPAGAPPPPPDPFAALGSGPGGVPIVTQGGWGAAFGSYEIDKEFAGASKIVPVGGKDQQKDEPGASVALIFYLLLFILVALPLTVFCLVLVYVPVKLPPHI